MRMIVAIETVLLCAGLFLMCFWGTGTDDKNLKSYSSYPDEVRGRIRGIAEYQGRFREAKVAPAFLANFFLFLSLFLVLGLFFKEKSFVHNFVCLSVLGQGLNVFDLVVIDLVWWRNARRIRLSRIPEKEPYQNPKKHVEAFGRALAMYLLVALIDGYLLTLL